MISLHTRIRFYIVLLCLSAPWPDLSAQNVLTEMDFDAHHIYDRMIILSGGGDSSLHSALKPFWRGDLVSLADSFSVIALDGVSTHQVQSIWDQNNEFVKPPQSSASSTVKYIDTTNTFYYSRDTTSARYRLSKHALWKTFYRTPAHFYEVDVTDFYLRVNPLIHLGVGYESEEGVTTFINQRGLSIRGGVGKNVFFQTSLYDSQVRYANYINQYTDSLGVVPGVGFFKDYTSSVFDVTNGRDFFIANAYVGVNLGKYIGFQLGHNQYFIGEGIRSMLLSDFSTPYFSLKINTRIWKFHYQNIFAELAADNFNSSAGYAGLVPKKYMAAHYLSFKPGRTVSLGLFESVIFNRPNHAFELQYLNPIILYRTVESALGSPDNVLLGFNVRVDTWRTVSFYGQFVLDDILIREILDGHLDWWGNKFGHQLGVKYINALGINHLDVQVEWNQARPYTFSHYDANANYSNYKQNLAHPLGANFNEWIASVRYRPAPKWVLESRIYFMSTGEDSTIVSYGGNVIKPNTLRPGDYGHHIGQGVATDIVYWSSGIHFELTSGVFIDAQYIYRKKTSALPELSLKTNLFQFGVRCNMARREEVF